MLTGFVGVGGATAVTAVFVVFGPPVGGGVDVVCGFETFFVNGV